MTTSARQAVRPDLGVVEEVVRQHLGGRTVRLAVVGLSRDDHPKAVVMVTPTGGTAPVLAVKAEGAGR